MEPTARELFQNAEDRRAYEEFCANQEAVPAFELDRPALVCRWRMAKRTVPLLNRHIRALSQRVVMGEPLTRNMLSWAKQHVEWSLADGAYDDPSGVLMLVIDVNGNAAMTVGAYEPLPDTSAAALASRAAQARDEAAKTGVAPELLCCVRDGALHVAAECDEALCGTGTLVEQLASTRGYEIVRDGSVDSATAAPVALISDEHGVVVSDEAMGAETTDAEMLRFFSSGVAKLYS